MKILLAMIISFALYVAGGILLEHLGVEGNAHYATYGLVFGVSYSSFIDLVARKS